MSEDALRTALQNLIDAVQETDLEEGPYDAMEVAVADGYAALEAKRKPVLPTGCEWTMPRPPGMPFRVYKKDETDRHSAWYVVMPGGAMIEFNHHADDDVDRARAVFVAAACNAALGYDAACKPVGPG